MLPFFPLALGNCFLAGQDGNPGGRERPGAFYLAAAGDAGCHVPVDVLYRRASYLLLACSGDLWHGLGSMGPFGVASVPSNWMVLYAAGYLAFCLFWATKVFQKKDI